MNKKFNVIWILSDQHRTQSMSCHGDPNVNTPNMDRMSIYGVDFTNAISGFPLCCPFRGSMLTSQYPHKCVSGHDFRIRDNQQTIANVFNDNNYDTSYFGKWHVDSQLLGTSPENSELVEMKYHDAPDGRTKLKYVNPSRRGGFNKWLGYENGNAAHNICLHGHDKNGELDPLLLPGFEADTLTDLLINDLKEKDCNSDEPFFAVLSMTPPHDPYCAPEEFMSKHNPNDVKLRPNVPDLSDGYRTERKKGLAGYNAMIENIDKNIGRIRSYLEESGLDRDTHVIYFSDHGDSHGSNGVTTKMNPYEESIRIPFLVHQAQRGGRAYGRHKTDAVLNHVDISPTTLGLCGITAPEWMEGYDYSHYCLGGNPKKDEPQAAYIQQVIPTGHPNSIGQPWRGVVTRDGWKYVCTPGMDWLMFNLNEDKYEQRNLTHHQSYFEKREELRDQLNDFIEKTDDLFVLPPKLNTFNSMSIEENIKNNKKRRLK